jgi:hypothetical protein
VEIIIGFVLGVVSSVLASFLFSWVTAIFPFERQRWFIAFLRNPMLKARIAFRAEDRKIRDRIHRVFCAWRDKDLESYLSCWAEDCIRIIGSSSTVKEDKLAIAEKFKRSCEEYREISTPIVVIDNIKISPDGCNAVAEVYYRFELTRIDDSLPAVESSREFYSLRLSDGDWIIFSNIDYFTESGTGALHSGLF